MDPGVFKEVVLPLMGMNKCATLAISTPENENNHYSVMMEMKDPETGMRIFKVLRVGLACNRCLIRGIPHLCTHPRSLPPWKSLDKQEIIEAMYGDSAADKLLMLRETHGLTVSADVYMYRMYMPQFQLIEPYQYRDKIQVVHVGIDPANGGVGSDWCIASTAFENMTFVIVGLDTINTLRFQEIEAMYIRHIGSILGMEVYKDCLLSIAIESNSSMLEAGRIACNIVKAFPYANIQFVCSQVKTAAVGVWTGEVQKEDYAKTLLEMLATDQLHFAADTVAVSDNWKKHKVKLIDQMSKFRMIEKVPKDPAFMERHHTYSGKAHGQMDDCVLALQITLSNHKKQRMDPEFRAMCSAQGKRF